MALSIGAMLCVGLATLAAGTTPGPGVLAPSSLDRAAIARASSAMDRTSTGAYGPVRVGGGAIPSDVVSRAEDAARAEAAKAETERKAAEDAAKAEELKKVELAMKAEAAKKAAAAQAAANPTPVAGLTQAQMNNSAKIVAAGKSLGMSKRSFVLAIACALQESNLYNLASDVLPESYSYAHEGTGSDHDSVGLFQQRPSSGWGSVKNLMNPTYAATQFYKALTQVAGWDQMALTYAVQAVQVSAFPEAYAKHEPTAQAVVNALA